MKRAFTLLEVLVVVAIIAVLAALLLPVVAQALEHGRATECLSNLRALAAANFAYVAEHDGQFVPAQDAANLVRWHGTRTSGTQTFDPTKGPLAPYLGGEGRVKICPTLAHVLTGSKSFETGAGGYGYNAAYIGGIPGDPFTAERSGRVEHPATTVMFTDTAFPRSTGLQEYPFSEPWVSEYEPGQYGGPLNASVHFRHLGRANVAWCDGHATSELPTQLDGKNGYGGDATKYGIGWFGPSAQNGYWRPY